AFSLGESGIYSVFVFLDFGVTGAPSSAEPGTLDLLIQQLDVKLDPLPATVTPPSQSLNISTRASVGTSDSVLIAGIIISGSDPATVVFRALGHPLTAFGVAGILENPTLELHDSTGAEIAISFDWKENSAEDQMVLTDNGLAPTDDFESAIVMTLNPGAYTAIVSGENDTTGVSVVEAYNLSSDTAHSNFA